MKSKLMLVLTVAAFFSPASVLATGESKKISEMNPLSIKCLKDAKAEWSKGNPDVKFEDVVKDAKAAKKSAPAT